MAITNKELLQRLSELPLNLSDLRSWLHYISSFSGLSDPIYQNYKLYEVQNYNKLTWVQYSQEHGHSICLQAIFVILWRILSTAYHTNWHFGCYFFCSIFPFSKVFVRCCLCQVCHILLSTHYYILRGDMDTCDMNVCSFMWHLRKVVINSKTLYVWNTSL